MVRASSTSLDSIKKGKFVTPAHFDTAIVIEDPQLYKSDGLGGLAGEFLSH